MPMLSIVNIAMKPFAVKGFIEILKEILKPLRL